MRRTKDSLLPIELAILEAAIDLSKRDVPEFHGFALAKEMRDSKGARQLTAHGTLYRALDRLEVSGLLESRTEDAETAAAANRPRRHLYRVTAAGEKAFAAQAAGRSTMTQFISGRATT